MSVRDFGNPPIFSTTASTTSDPAAGGVVAELILSTTVFKHDANYEVRFTVGASTGANWFLECALSSAADSTSFRAGPPPSSGIQQFNVFTGSNQTSEFVYTLRAEPGDRFRIRANSSFTGAVGASIQAEPLT